MGAATRQQALRVYIFLLVQAGARIASGQPSLQSPAPKASNSSQPSEIAPQLAPSPGSSNTCELEVLKQLGWQQAYHPDGYSINAQLPASWSSVTWQSLGCLTTLNNLTLTGSLPSLPDSWASNGTFSSLTALDLSHAQLNGTLPTSWGSPHSFPQLRTLNLTDTQLSGTLPACWGYEGAFEALQVLHLGGGRPGVSRLSGSLPPEWGSPTAFSSLSLLWINYCNVSGTP